MNYQATGDVNWGTKPVATLMTFVAFAVLCGGCKTPLPFPAHTAAPVDAAVRSQERSHSAPGVDSRLDAKPRLDPHAAQASIHDSTAPAVQSTSPQVLAAGSNSEIQLVGHSQQIGQPKVAHPQIARLQIGDLPAETTQQRTPAIRGDSVQSPAVESPAVQPLPQTHATGCECDDCDARTAAQPARIHRRGPPVYHTAPYAQTLPPSAYGSNYPRDLRHSPADAAYCQEEDVTNLFRDPDFHDPDAQWAPPGVAKPWPSDEYIFDGGDRERKVRVLPNWDVQGIDQQDTVVHYDTKDGRTEVQESNRVAIYAPRFSSVRKIYGVALEHNTMRTGDVLARTSLGRADETAIASTVLQPIQPARDTGTTTVNIFRDRTGGANLDSALAMAEIFDDQLMTHENFQIIQQGKFNHTEKLRLSQQIQAAFTWTLDQGVQVIIDDQAAVVSTDARSSGEIVKYELPKGKPRVRIVKVASKADAQPGEIIDFTIRFDNIGDQVVGNVTIIDNLTTRLEYVPDSAKCDIDSEFFTIENEGESLVLRWEIAKPLPVNKGGVIRFKCKVR
ncbi:MAG: putative repeat protein (TIGR01451 family) [Pirellulaceae bacterium]|jgi:uncharacterized repeat protein (TIGR01451 family)